MLERIVQRTIVAGAILSGLYSCGTEDTAVIGSSEAYADIKLNKENVYSDSTSENNPFSLQKDALNDGLKSQNDALLDISQKNLTDSSDNDSKYDTKINNTKDIFSGKEGITSDVPSSDIFKDTLLADIPTNKCPEIKTPNNYFGKEGVSLSFAVSATDADNDNLEYYIENIPFGATFDQNVQSFSWIPTCNQDGVYTISLYAKDKECTVSQQITLQIEDASLKKYFQDKDGDGYGLISKLNCFQPNGFVLLGGDCDDANLKINPSAQELCDYLDNNCNEEIDEKYNVGVVCNKGIGECNSEGKYICKNELETICGAVEKKPALEICDTLDNDCNGIVDDTNAKDCFNACGKTGLEYCVNGQWTQCNAPPVPTEVCDGKDNDCNGKVDDGNLTQTGFCGFNDIGECKTGNSYSYCYNGKYSEFTDCEAIFPNKEICDGKDNNCNGKTDEGFEDIIELCDDIDNNCNGKTDEGVATKKYFEDKDGDGEGNILVPKDLCKLKAGYSENSFDCDDGNSKIKTGSVIWKSTESCDETSLLAVDGNGVFFSGKNDGKLYKISTKDGVKNTTFTDNSNNLRDPIVYNSLVYGTQTEQQKYLALVLDTVMGKTEGQYYITNCNKDPVGKVVNKFGTIGISLGFEGKMYLSTFLVDDDWVYDDTCGLLEVVEKIVNESNAQFLSAEWKVDIGPNNRGSSIGPAEIIYVATDSSINVYYPNGNVKSQNNMGGGYKFPPIFGPNGVMYTINTSGDLLKVDANYSIAWTDHGFGKHIPVIDLEGHVYTTAGIVSEEQKKCGLFGYNTCTVAKNTSYDPTVGQVSEPLITKEILYLAGESGLHAIDPKTGKIMWNITKDGITKIPLQPTHLNIDENGRLYFCNAVDNKVYSICANSSLNPNDPWPMQRHDPGNTRNYNMPIK